MDTPGERATPPAPPPADERAAVAAAPRLHEPAPPPDAGEPMGSKDPDRPAMLGRRFRATMAIGMGAGLAIALIGHSLLSHSGRGPESNGWSWALAAIGGIAVGGACTLFIYGTSTDRTDYRTDQTARTRRRQRNRRMAEDTQPPEPPPPPGPRPTHRLTSVGQMRGCSSDGPGGIRTPTGSFEAQSPRRTRAMTRARYPAQPCAIAGVRGARSRMAARARFPASVAASVPRAREVLAHAPATARPGCCAGPRVQPAFGPRRRSFGRCE
jgi:hypothetical protein